MTVCLALWPGCWKAMRARMRVLPVLEGLLLLLFLVLPLCLVPFWITFVTRVLILSLLALSFDLAWGYSGILSFGQALFFGTSAYITALLATRAEVTSVFLALPIAAVVGGGLAVLVASMLLLSTRLSSGIYVALGTLAAAYAAERLARGWTEIGAANGIPDIPLMTAGRLVIGEGTGFYYLAFSLLVVLYTLFRFLVHSQFGLVLAGIRGSEPRMAFFGYQVQRFKAIVFTLGGAVAGMAGGLYAFHEGFVWPNLVGVVLSTQVVLSVLFGGVGTLIGAVIGVAVIEYASFELSERFPDMWPIVLGLLLLIIIMFRPSGLVGFLATERERIGTFGWRGARGGGVRDGDTDVAA